jgi:hypothetical protein
MKLIVECPLNSLSFGNVSYNILRELWKKNIETYVFPIGKGTDISAYDQIDPAFQSWLQQAINSRYSGLDRDTPTLKLWHLNGSDLLRTPNQYLYTFYELDQPTQIEKTIAGLQAKTIFSSEHAASCFGLENTTNIPIGFDTDFKKRDKQYLGEGIVHFGIMGKYENRKHTKKIIQLWLDHFGNNNKYQLTCCITNPFIKEEQMNHLLSDLLGGKNYNNINFLPYLKTNSEVNDYLNAIDIELSGLSGAEGWNLPAFNAACLGKWPIVLNSTSHKDWANAENSILIEPNGKTLAADGVFFAQQGDFNQGFINTFNDEIVISSMEEAAKKKGAVNENGVKLQERFTYENTVSKLLELMG